MISQADVRVCDDQPLDPLFCSVGESVLLADESIATLGDADLAFVQGPEGPEAPLRLMKVQNISSSSASLARSGQHATMVLLTGAVALTGISLPPATLRAIYAGLGVDGVVPPRAAGLGAGTSPPT